MEGEESDEDVEYSERRREKEEGREQGKQRTRYKGRRSRWVYVLSIDQTHWQTAGSESWVLGPGLNPPRMQLTKPGLGDGVQWPGCSQETMENSRWSRRRLKPRFLLLLVVLVLPEGASYCTVPGTVYRTAFLSVLVATITGI